MLITSSRAAETPIQRTTRRILIADDNKAVADSLQMLLEIMGIEARTAYGGLEALEIAARWRPNTIFLDIGMPKLNGYETARRIRNTPWGKDIGLIALTGWGQQQDKECAKQAGFDHHLVKPVDPAVIEELLEPARTPPPNRPCRRGF
jgi:CheY-like chemotaxis protein